MALFQPNNPVLNEKTFQQAAQKSNDYAMTVKGTANKTAFLLALALCAAVYSWGAFERGVNVIPFLLIGSIGGLVIFITLLFKQEWAGYLSPAYALAQGLVLGVISSLYSHLYAGIVLQAVGLTFGTAFGMLLLYKLRIIRATEKFKSIVFTATAGIAIFYLIAWVLRMFSIDIPFLHEGSMIGIIFSVVVVAIAALNLILHFDRIEQGAAYGMPKWFEWYAAFGLLVTLIWLYLEILQLLAKINGNSRR